MELTEELQCRALTKAYEVTTLLNYAILPDNPESYISEYQVSLITTALEMKADVAAITGVETRYEKAYEFTTAIEGIRAALVYLQTEGHLL